MNIIIDQKQLLRSIQGIAAVVPTKTSLPILSTFLMESRGEGRLSLTANDLDVSLTTTVEGETQGGGSVAVPGKKFFEIVRSLPEEKVEIEVEGEKIAIKCRKSRFKVMGKPAEEFPKLPEQKPVASFSLATAVMEEMVNKTAYAVSSDLTRPSLCGVLWELKDGNLGMVATDGHRLAKVELEGAVAGVANTEFVVSPKSLNILRALSAGSEETAIAVAENHITFDFGEHIIYSRLLEGPFPDYNQVIPRKNTKRLVVNREELADACRRVSILSSVITHQVKLVIAKEKLTINVSTPDVGEAAEEVPCSFGDGQMEIGYNARYLLDILRTMDSGSVAFLLDRNDNAGMMIPEGSESKLRHQCLLMPLRLTD